MNKESPNEKIIATNRRARYQYFLLDELEAGLELTGTEIKSLRGGHCSISEAYVEIKNGEAFVVNMDIPVYKEGSIFNHAPKRTRKLLLHKAQIAKLASEVKTKGVTIVPVRCYLKNGRAKLQIALARGKNAVDKRETIKNRDIKKRLDRALKEGH